jgi:glycogen(starch) synthase
MHILITADTLGGVWTYTRELVKGLASSGVKMTLVSFGEIPSEEQTRWMEGVRDLDYRPTAFKLEWMQNSEEDMESSSAYLQELVREVNPDLLHFNQYYYGALQCDVPRVVVAHSDVLSWGSCVHQTPPAESAWLRWYRAAVTRGLAAATCVVAPSRWMLQQIHKFYLTPARGEVVYNGRTPTLFNSNARKNGQTITIGRLWDSGKNAALLLREPMPGDVHIVGAERHPESNSDAFVREEIPANVHLEPQQGGRELSEMLASSSIYAATSQYEPFGLAPLEAALSRCAIVASDIPTFRELWGESAIFFRNNDAQHLQEVLHSLSNDPVRRDIYAEKAYQHACRNFTASCMVGAYLDLYHSLVPESVAAR